MEKNKKDEVEKFSQADELIKAVHKMEHNELKMVFYFLSKRKKGELYVNTTISELLSKLNKSKGGKNYLSCHNAAIKLMTSSYIEVKMKAWRLGKDVMERNGWNEDSVVSVKGILIPSVIISDENNNVEIKFNPEFTPMLDDLKKEHTWMYFEQLARLDGKYSARFYEFCKMHLKDNVKLIEPFIWYLNGDSEKAPSMRQFLNVGDKYSDWRNFKRMVVDSSVNEINKKCSDMYVDYTPVKNKHVYGIELRLYSSRAMYEADQKRVVKNADEKKEEFSQEIKDYNPFVEENNDEPAINNEYMDMLERLKNGTL